MTKTEESVKKLQARALHAMRRMLAEPVVPPQRAPEPVSDAIASVSAPERMSDGAERLALLLAAAIQRMRSQV